MSGSSDVSLRSTRFEARSLLFWFQRNTIVVLVLLLLLFVAAVEVMKPGTVNPVWLSNTLLFAAPLGILAAGQTMVMLTGGIDLSVVSVAMSLALFRRSRLVSGWAWLWERSMAWVSLCLAFSHS
jgi:ribose/xylose/arabinose/galactoside ABC-type transport system permease subunit